MGHENRETLFVDVERDKLIATCLTNCNYLQSSVGSGDFDEIISLPGKRVVNEQWPKVARRERLGSVIAGGLCQQLHSLIEKKICFLLGLLHVAHVLPILVFEFASIVKLRPARIPCSAMLIVSKQ